MNCSSATYNARAPGRRSRFRSTREVAPYRRGHRPRRPRRHKHSSEKQTSGRTPARPPGDASSPGQRNRRHRTEFENGCSIGIGAGTHPDRPADKRGVPHRTFRDVVPEFPKCAEHRSVEESHSGDLRRCPTDPDRIFARSLPGVCSSRPRRQSRGDRSSTAHRE